MRRGLHRPVDIVGRKQVKLGDRSAAAGIERLHRLPGRARDITAADKTGQRRARKKGLDLGEQSAA
jgi:hypothetical protein